MAYHRATFSLSSGPRKPKAADPGKGCGFLGVKQLKVRGLTPDRSVASDYAKTPDRLHSVLHVNHAPWYSFFKTCHPHGALVPGWNTVASKATEAQGIAFVSFTFV